MTLGLRPQKDAAGIDKPNESAGLLGVRSMVAAALLEDAARSLGLLEDALREDFSHTGLKVRLNIENLQQRLLRSEQEIRLLEKGVA